MNDATKRALDAARAVLASAAGAVPDAPCRDCWSEPYPCRHATVSGMRLDELRSALAALDAAPAVEWRMHRGAVEGELHRATSGQRTALYVWRSGDGFRWELEREGVNSTGHAATLDEAKAAAERAAGLR